MLSEARGSWSLERKIIFHTFLVPQKSFCSGNATLESQMTVLIVLSLSQPSLEGHVIFMQKWMDNETLIEYHSYLLKTCFPQTVLLLGQNGILSTTHNSKIPLVRSGDCEGLSDLSSCQWAPVCYGWEHGESRATSGIFWKKKLKRHQKQPKTQCKCKLVIVQSTFWWHYL